MSRLLEQIKTAVRDERFLVSWHADERCEERGISVWQVVAGLDRADLIEDRPGSLPNPSIVVRHELADGSDVTAIWAWLDRSARAKLVTVYFDSGN